MPSSPVFGNGLRKERCLKVFRQPDSKNFGNSEHNVHTTRKIGVKLECIADRSQPDICTLIGVVVSIDRVYDQIHTLGNYQRLEKSPEHSLHTEGNLLIIKGMRCKKLFCILTVFHNRSG